MVIISSVSDPARRIPSEGEADPSRPVITRKACAMVRCDDEFQADLIGARIDDKCVHIRRIRFVSCRSFAALEWAKSRGDVLIVGVHSDEDAQSYKRLR